jgi:hypothetical protein
VQYQVRWLGWGPEWDQWYDLDKLGNAKELVEEYERMHDKKICNSRTKRHYFRGPTLKSAKAG